jgi:hypothetical protein
LVAPVGAILRLPTPTPPSTPTPYSDGNIYGGCAAWIYLLHWDRPSRIAQMKNALGDQVNIYSEFYPPGSTVLNQTTTPWTIQRDGNGLAVGGASDGSSWATPLELGASWQAAAAAGATIEYHQGTALQSYIASLPVSVPVQSGAVSIPIDSRFPPGVYAGVLPVGPNTGGTYHLAAFDGNGDQATWAWTLTYGTSGPDTLYGPDPGRPFQAYDETVYNGSNFPPTPLTPSYLNGLAIEVGTSIPGVTGTPVGKAAAFVKYETARKIVSGTANTVNWGMYSFSDVSTGDETTACSEDANYRLIQHSVPTDSGEVAAIQAALNLVYYGGIYTQGATPSKEGLKRAGADLYNYSYKNDTKVAFCERPYGLIFATDGASNVCNPNGSNDDWTGPPTLPPCDCSQSPPAPPAPYTQCAGCSDNPGFYQFQGGDFGSAGEPWTSPCEGFYGFDQGCYTPVLAPDGTTRLLHCCDKYARISGSGYDCDADELSSDAAKINNFKDAPVPSTWVNVDPGFVAGVAESLFVNGFVDAGKNKVHVRTFTIGLSSNVGRCELNYTAFRGRTDASAPKGDAGYGYVAGSGDPGDPRLLQPGVEETDALIYQKSVGSGDYAFFATNPQAIYDAFLEIIAGTAVGDYATSPPVAGSNVSQSNIVLIPSTDYPGWLGRLRAIDSLKNPGDTGYLKWDAGDILSNPSNASHVSPAQRKIFTWNPADLAGGLIELAADDATAAAVQTISGVPGTFTKNVIDFLRGNDGTLTDTIRGWVFGASINSSPAIVGTPEVYNGSVLASHAAFEVEYKNRNPVAWVGADDGMLHAFDFATGKEILALMPPELLPQQVTLFTNYRTLVHPNGTRSSLTGQYPDINNHLWGIANSLRVADVYDGTIWKTIGYLALGPAGKSITAIDITHPTTTDPHYDATKPVELLWRKSVADLPALGQAWSIPAITAVATASPKFLALFGSGFNASSSATNPDGTSQIDAKLFQLNAVDGSDGYTTGTKNNVTLPVATLDPSNRPIVGHQAFADSVLLDTTKPTFYGNNIANLGVQVDLDGRFWFNYPTAGTADFDQIQLGIDVPEAIHQIEGASDQAPLYYPPASSGRGTHPFGGCQVYSFGSGSAYEKSPLVTDPSGDAAPAGQSKSDYAWSPRLLIAVNSMTTAPFGPITVTGPNQKIFSVPIASIELPACDPDNPGPRCKLGVTDPTTLGPKTQMTAPPFLLVPLSGQGSFQALYLVFDPEAIGYCRGYSYIIVFSFILADNCSTVTVSKTEVFGAGEGAASGFALAGTEVVVGKSGVGSGQQAGVVKTPVNILSYGSFGNATPVYWKELK